MSSPNRRRHNYRIPSDIDLWDAENVFYLKAPTSRFAKLLAHYELCRRIQSLPGAIVECGVYKGASLCRFAAFRTLLENDDSRRIYGFDTFGTFPTEGLSSRADLTFIENFEAAGGGGISLEDLQQALSDKGYDNIELIKGDVKETVPALLERTAHLRVALLHLDLDVYEPTRACLDHFLPHMTPGGLIVFDDYNAVEGATRAADELCKSSALAIQKLPFYNVPSFVQV